MLSENWQVWWAGQVIPKKFLCKENWQEKQENKTRKFWQTYFFFYARPCFTINFSIQQLKWAGVYIQPLKTKTATSPPTSAQKKLFFFHSQMTLKIFLVQREILKQWTLIIVFSKNGKYSKILCQISRSTPRTESFSAKLKAFERNEQITPRPVLSEISQNDFRKTFLEHPWTTSSGRFSKNRALTIRYEREIQKLRVAFGKSQNSNFLITLSENYLEITILPKKVNFLQKSGG